MRGELGHKVWVGHRTGGELLGYKVWMRCRTGGGEGEGAWAQGMGGA